MDQKDQNEEKKKRFFEDCLRCAGFIFFFQGVLKHCTQSFLQVICPWYFSVFVICYLVFFFFWLLLFTFFLFYVAVRIKAWFSLGRGSSPIFVLQHRR